MSSRTDHNAKPVTEQAKALPTDDWQQEIVPRLPAGWHEQARRLKA